MTGVGLSSDLTVNSVIEGETLMTPKPDPETVDVDLKICGLLDPGTTCGILLVWIFFCWAKADGSSFSSSSDDDDSLGDDSSSSELLDDSSAVDDERFFKWLTGDVTADVPDEEHAWCCGTVVVLLLWGTSGAPQRPGTQVRAIQISFLQEGRSSGHHWDLAQGSAAIRIRHDQTYHLCLGG